MDTDRPLAGIAILVVEDDPAGARLLFRLLTNEGADVRTAGSAEEALAVLQQFSPRLLLVDLVLPRMGGLLLVEHLKANPSTRGIVAVAVSAINGPDAERMAVESGCAGYISKPIDVQSFAHTLITHLRGQS